MILEISEMNTEVITIDTPVPAIPTIVRKQRITKRESQAFTEWLRSNEAIQEWSIAQIIDEYRRITNVNVSRMFVSNIRKRIRA